MTFSPPPVPDASSHIRRGWAISSMASLSGSMLTAFIFLSDYPEHNRFVWGMAVLGSAMVAAFPVVFVIFCCLILPLESYAGPKIRQSRLWVYSGVGGVSGSLVALAFLALFLAHPIRPLFGSDLAAVIFHGKLLLVGFSFGFLTGLFTALHAPSGR